MQNLETIKAEKANRSVRQINRYANDITKCLEGMPCNDCREQVIAGVSAAVKDIETEQCLIRLALSRLGMTSEKSKTNV